MAGKLVKYPTHYCHTYSLPLFGLHLATHIQSRHTTIITSKVNKEASAQLRLLASTLSLYWLFRVYSTTKKATACKIIQEGQLLRLRADAKG